VPSSPIAMDVGEGTFAWFGDAWLISFTDAGILSYKAQSSPPPATVIIVFPIPSPPSVVPVPSITLKVL